MSFDEVQFPTDVSYGAVGGARYKTDIVETLGGHEQRNSVWSDSRGRWLVSHTDQDTSVLKTLNDFFHARKGRARGFRFKDWGDFSAENQQIGVGDGVDTTFQLIKTYTSGGQTVTRDIKKPVSGSISIFKDAVLQTITTHYTVSTTTGIVTFVSAPANGVVITAAFDFDVPARFDTDNIDLSIDLPNGGSWLQIPIIEIKV